VSETQTGGVSDDPGRIIYELEQGLKTANATISNQSADIARLQAEWQSEFNAAQQLRSEVAQLERLLGEAREELQQLQADQAADEQHSEGERAAYLGIIKALWECERATS
jgi:chromosome segregation ATPase